MDFLFVKHPLPSPLSSRVFCNPISVLYHLQTNDTCTICKRWILSWPLGLDFSLYCLRQCFSCHSEIFVKVSLCHLRLQPPCTLVYILIHQYFFSVSLCVIVVQCCSVLHSAVLGWNWWWRKWDFVLSLQNEYEKKHNLTSKPYVYEVFGNRSVVVDVGTSWGLASIAEKDVLSILHQLTNTEVVFGDWWCKHKCPAKCRMY